MPEILMISKPVAPPWNDSGKNIVHDLVKHLPDFKFRVMTPKGRTLGLSHVTEEPIYKGGGSYAPSLSSKIRVMLRMFKPDSNVGIYHFFFAPNKLSSRAAKLALACKKSKKAVQTVSSSPRSYEGFSDLIFGDKVIVLSEFNRRKCAEAGIKNVVRIYPGVDAREAVSAARAAEKRREIGLHDDEVMVLYAGDWEFGGAVEALSHIIQSALERNGKIKFVLACRLKTERAKEEERKVRFAVRQAGRDANVIFLNETADILDLLAACDVHIFPVRSLYAKMDIPLVLLETMREKKPMLLSDMEPLREALQGDSDMILSLDQIDAWVEKILALAADPALRDNYGQRCKEIFGDLFRADIMARQYADVYKELFGS